MHTQLCPEDSILHKDIERLGTALTNLEESAHDFSTAYDSLRASYNDALAINDRLRKENMDYKKEVGTLSKKNKELELELEMINSALADQRTKKGAQTI